MSLLDQKSWENFLANHPDAHLLQTSLWGELKGSFGWDVVRVGVNDVGAQVLLHRLPFGFKVAYIPKGPLGSTWLELWSEIDALCKEQRAIFLKVEPDTHMASEETSRILSNQGFELSSHAIQPMRTLVVDINGKEEEILGRMKQKTRYNIRLAVKRGVIVQSSSNPDEFYELMQLTGERDEFGIHSLEYYRRCYELFNPRGECELLLARYEGQILAGLMVFSRAKRAWYLYGASGNQNRDLMPTYLLQWEAMRWARRRGCTSYDLWGIPDEDEETLETQFASRNDGLWGVYRFKRGFGGVICRSAGSWDRVYQPVLYRFYRWWLGRAEN